MMHGMTSGPIGMERRLGYRDTPAGERQARVLQALERAAGRRRAEIVAGLPLEHDQYRRYLRGDTPLRWDQIATFAAAYGVSTEHVARELGLIDGPPPPVTVTRLSAELAELERQTEHLAPEIREQILRSWRESVAILNAASELARRN